MEQKTVGINRGRQWVKYAYCSLVSLLFAVPLPAQTLPEISLTPGLVIRKSCRIKPVAYRLDTKTAVVDIAKPEAVIMIAGEGITVDFQNADLRSTADPLRPDLFSGLAIRVEGKNVTVKNAQAHGYKVGLLANGTEGLLLENCDFSYNYRPRLHSLREREDYSDWLSYHQNDHDEWLRYGAGIYLKNCVHATVKSCRITSNQNALLLTGCTGGLFYNNIFQFNSGIGIGLYRSSRNRVMHNRLDWNVRGHSFGFYERGQDSAAILCYEQSSHNTFAYNSCTHSGDGFFLWAGQSTMDTGEGGCNDNLIFGNDFSHAPTNGVEVTFSRNRIAGNMITDCNYGIWGGYSYETTIFGNMITECRTGIAIEQGQQDTIQQNLFEDDTVGIRLWARASQPDDWVYAQKRDVRSRDGFLDRNVFLSVRRPLNISASQNMVLNGDNLFFDFEKLLETPQPNENLKFIRNEIYGTAAEIAEVWQIPALAASQKINFSHVGDPEHPYSPLEIPVISLHEPDSLPDGMLAALNQKLPHGKKNILIGEWGPYDFRRPLAVLAPPNKLKKEKEGVYTLRLLGPAGDWRLIDKKGVAEVSATHGQFPDEFWVRRTPDAAETWLQFEYLGPETLTTEFGEKIQPMQPYRFVFERLEQQFNWKIQFFNYPAGDNPLPPEDFKKLMPASEQTASELAFAWWDAPAAGVQADHFATLSQTTFTIAPGQYRIELRSDDGARLYLDGKRLIDHWDVHEPAVDEVTVTLGGQHTIVIEHFDAGGFATLDFRMKVVR